jgi:cytochrome c553
MKAFSLILMSVAVFMTNAAAAAADGDINAGKKKSSACVVCHGSAGVGTMPDFPNLRGQKALYLAAQLTAFREGTRSNENMGIVVKSLSDQDIEDLAAYYESLKPGCPDQ